VGFDELEIRHAIRDDCGSVSTATELKGFFDHTLQLCLQLNQVSGRRLDYWGRPACFARNCLLIFCGLGTGGVGVHVRCPEGGENISGDDFLGEIFKVGDVSVCTAAFFEVPSVSSVVRPFRLRTSWKPPSCVVCCPVAFGELVPSARVLALSTAFNSSEVTVQVPYRALKFLSTESFAVARSVFFLSIYNDSPLRTFPYRGWCVSRHILNVAQQIKELF
jgi:hypothetical protein